MQVEHRDNSDVPRGRIDQMALHFHTIVWHRINHQGNIIDVLRKSICRRNDVIARLGSTAERIPNLNEDKRPCCKLVRYNNDQDEKLHADDNTVCPTNIKLG